MLLKKCPNVLDTLSHMASFSFLSNIIHGATLTKSNLRYIPDEREFLGYINSVIGHSYGIPAHKQVQKVNK